MKRFVAMGLGVSLVSLFSCGDGKPPAAPTGPAKGPTVSNVDQYFPLEEGRIYHYVTSESGETGMLVAKVHRTDASHGELSPLVLPRDAFRATHQRRQGMSSLQLIYLVLPTHARAPAKSNSMSISICAPLSRGARSVCEALAAR